MKCIIALSADGFLAQNKKDNMSWTGELDKKIFKLLTLSGNTICYCPRATYKLLPKLPGRTVFPISSKPGYFSLEKAVAKQNSSEAYLIGGPTILEEALSRGHIDTLIVNVLTSVKLGLGLTSPRVLDLLAQVQRAHLPESPAAYTPEDLIGYNRVRWNANVTTYIFKKAGTHDSY